MLNDKIKKKNYFKKSQRKKPDIRVKNNLEKIKEINK
jgi:hypothetical protein